jgi:hypothetical protein
LLGAQDLHKANVLVDEKGALQCVDAELFLYVEGGVTMPLRYSLYGHPFSGLPLAPEVTNWLARVLESRKVDEFLAETKQQTMRILGIQVNHDGAQLARIWRRQCDRLSGWLAKEAAREKTLRCIVKCLYPDYAERVRNAVWSFHCSSISKHPLLDVVWNEQLWSMSCNLLTAVRGPPAWCSAKATEHTLWLLHDE